jgi:uncharacterized lipoprotein YddW (UPF0748 family)
MLAATSLQGATYEPASVLPPKPQREFRAAWVATVGNIDWPSKPGLTTAEQKAEMVTILDRAAQLKLNAIIFQVRPACDAMYASQIEPWSYYLTGAMGQAPQPFYDPLAFAVEEAHKRGLELHAWFNPYRALVAAEKSPVAANHISKKHPQLVRQYGKYLWLDPGEKAVQDYSLSVIMDVVKRYDVDGVHFDDYFYPYKEKDSSGKDMEFPDDASWKRFGAGGKLSRDDWRRENVNTFISRVYRSIKAAKPYVKFGVSPFGIWRPGYPQQIQGYDAYEKLYADSKKWLANGWLDYFAPQLYWGIEPPEQSFPVLLKWWDAQNSKGRHVWPGMNTTRAGSRERPEGGDRRGRSVRWESEEILNQIRIARKQSTSSGHIHWNMKSLMRNSALDDALVKNVYAEPALIPASPWLGSARPEKPMLSVADAEGGKLRVSWSGGGTGKSHLWVLQTQSQEGEWKAEVLAAQHTSRTLEGQAPNVIAISAVDRLGNAGSPVVIRMKHEVVASAHPPAQPSTQPSSVQSTKEPKTAKKKLVSPKAKN